MMTYTMNGHQQPKEQVQPEILAGMLGNLTAQLTRGQSRLRARPEQFSCLDSAEPRIQLQEALKQIEVLLQKNSQLVETVYLLVQALDDAHSLVHKGALIRQSHRGKLHLSYDFTE